METLAPQHAGPAPTSFWGLACGAAGGLTIWMEAWHGAGGLLWAGWGHVVSREHAETNPEVLDLG